MEYSKIKQKSDLDEYNEFEKEYKILQISKDISENEINKLMKILETDKIKKIMVKEYYRDKILKQIPVNMWSTILENEQKEEYQQKLEEELDKDEAVQMRTLIEILSIDVANYVKGDNVQEVYRITYFFKNNNKMFEMDIFKDNVQIMTRVKNS